VELCLQQTKGTSLHLTERKRNLGSIHFLLNDSSHFTTTFDANDDLLATTYVYIISQGGYIDKVRNCARACVSAANEAPSSKRHFHANVSNFSILLSSHWINKTAARNLLSKAHTNSSGGGGRGAPALRWKKCRRLYTYIYVCTLSVGARVVRLSNSPIGPTKERTH
jgi:hypothetical protein